MTDDRRTENSPHSSQTRRAARLLYLEMIPISKISEDLDIPVPTLNSWHQRDGWASARARFQREIDEEAMKELRKRMLNSTLDFGQGQVELCTELQDRLLDRLEHLKSDRTDEEGNKIEVPLGEIEKLIGMGQKLQNLGKDIFRPFNELEPQNQTQIEGKNGQERRQEAVTVERNR